MPSTPSPYLELRRYFDSGASLSYTFRRARLLDLKAAIQSNVQAIAEAIKADLGKHPSETYFMETDFVLAEIDHQLTHLKQWMKPRRVGTPLALEWSSSTIHAQPKGVVLIISPWNFPFQLSLAPLVAAIGAGCTMLLKPSELAPRTAEVLHDILSSTFDQAYMTVVKGSGEELIPTWLSDHCFNHIFFTGSAAVGRKIAEMATKHLSSVTLELGGKSPAIVSASANIKVAAKRIVWGKFSNCGQTCIAPDYLLVEETIRAEFVQELIRSIKAFYGENPDESPYYGRIINTKRFDALVEMLEGQKVISGGKYQKASRYMEPTLLEPLDLDQSVMKEEIFGPLLPIVSFRTMDEAIAILERNPYPLAAYYFGKDKVWERYFREKWTFGGGVINNVLFQISNANLPFGGIHGSGIGSYHGEFGFQAFSHFKGVMKTASWPDINLKYPPYTSSKFAWLKRILKISRSMH